MKIAVDASALLAILLEEPDADDFMERILSASDARISPVNYWEVMVRIRQFAQSTGVARAEKLIQSLGVSIEPVTVEHTRFAVDAFARFGTGHPAKLNLGDCFAYALAKSSGTPLLFKGRDFPKTDIISAH